MTGHSKGSALFELFVEVGDELNIRTRPEFVTDEQRALLISDPQPAEAFEWMAMLGAIEDAERVFTMLELGAGFGRWSVRGAKAVARYRPDLRYRLVAVEAEPTHFLWLRQHTRDNGIRRWSRSGTCSLVRGAVSGEGPETQDFFAGNPSSWYGQVLVRPENSGWQGPSISVKTIRLSNLLERRGCVDLIDLDIQGLELEVLREARHALARVRRIYIETHSHAVDRELQSVFAGAAGRWSRVVGIPLGARRATPLGDAEFVGGAQLWQNADAFAT